MSIFSVLGTEKYSRVEGLFVSMASPDLQEDAKKIFYWIASAYTEPHRRYHTFDHLNNFIDQFSFFIDKRIMCLNIRQGFIGAMAGHDKIFNCKHNVDELESAGYTRGMMKLLGCSAESIDWAERFVLTSVSKNKADLSLPERLFYDMDVSVLAARPDVYQRYVEGVTYEYCTKLDLDEATLAKGRIELFLEPVLKSPAIFYSPQYKHLEPVARHNLQNELNAYKKGYVVRLEGLR